MNGIGIVEWKSLDGMTCVNYTFDIGKEDDGGQNTIYVQSIILEWQFNERSSYTLNSSYGFEENVAVNGANAQWYGFAHYLAHALTDRWIVGWRYDLFNDVDGTRVFPRAGFPATAPGIYQALTMGMNIVAHPNATLRPEVRWDWFDADGPLPPGPFDNGARRSQFIAAADLVVTF